MKFFQQLPNYFFMEASSFSCERTTTKVSGPVYELFSQVVINVKKHTECPNKSDLSFKLK